MNQTCCLKETKSGKERQGGLFGGLEQGDKKQTDVSDNKRLDEGSKQGRTTKGEKSIESGVGVEGEVAGILKDFRLKEQSIVTIKEAQDWLESNGFNSSR